MTPRIMLFLIPLLPLGSCSCRTTHDRAPAPARAGTGHGGGVSSARIYYEDVNPPAPVARQPASAPTAAGSAPNAPGSASIAAAPAAAVKLTGRTSVSFPRSRGAHSVKVTVNGVPRKVEIYRPADAPAGAPLLVTLHGTNDSAARMLEASGARSLADTEGVVVASPWARKLSRGDWDNHSGSERYWDTTSKPADNPDLQLLLAVLGEARRAYRVDPRRIYLLGHSNGGFFAIYAAMALPDRVAAFVANSSGLVRCPSTGSCKFKGQGRSCAGFRSQRGYCRCDGSEKPAAIRQQGRKVPGYLSHSAEDGVVSVFYTCELAARMKQLGYKVSLKVWTGEGHGMPFPLAGRAWPFLSSHRAPALRAR